MRKSWIFCDAGTQRNENEVPAEGAWRFLQPVCPTPPARPPGSPTHPLRSLSRGAASPQLRGQSSAETLFLLLEPKPGPSHTRGGRAQRLRRHAVLLANDLQSGLTQRCLVRQEKKQTPGFYDKRGTCVRTVTPSSLLRMNTMARAPLWSFPPSSLCSLPTNPAEREPKTSTTVDLIDTICFKTYTCTHVNDILPLIVCKDTGI